MESAPQLFLSRGGFIIDKTLDQAVVLTLAIQYCHNRLCLFSVLVTERMHTYKSICFYSCFLSQFSWIWNNSCQKNYVSDILNAEF